MKTYGLVFLGMLFVVTTWSQVQLTGLVKDAKGANITLTNVVATHSKDDRILAFTTTND